MMVMVQINNHNDLSSGPTRNTALHALISHKLSIWSNVKSTPSVNVHSYLLMRARASHDLIFNSSYKVNILCLVKDTFKVKALHAALLLIYKCQQFNINWLQSPASQSATAGQVKRQSQNEDTLGDADVSWKKLLWCTERSLAVLHCIWSLTHHPKHGAGGNHQAVVFHLCSRSLNASEGRREKLMQQKT